MKGLIKKILREQTSNTVLVVFGGLGDKTGDWISTQIPDSIKNSRTVITTGYSPNYVSKVIEELDKIEYSKLEVVGFSAGAKNVFRLAKVININFLGLIDPSVPKDWKVGLDKFPPGEDSILFFDNSNWNNWKEIQGFQIDLKEAMKDKRMNVDEVDLGHMKFPEEFFKNHMKQ